MNSSYEIGSEFTRVPLTDKKNDIFPAFARHYVSGRSALKAIISELDSCRSVALPSWCCDSMIKPFADAGIRVEFYPVYYDGGLKQEIQTDTDAILVMDYFGYSSDTLLPEYGGTVIRDVTHSLFSGRYDDADYYFGSLRKWCAVPAGGFAYANDGHPLCAGKEDISAYTNLRAKAMHLKDRYLSGESSADKGYLALFNEAEEMLDGFGAVSSNGYDTVSYENIDAVSIKRARRENAEILRSAFKDWLLFPNMKETDCPLFVPVLVPGGKRDALRAFLINRSVYCPVHWPVSKYHSPGEKERFIYDNELSLVCDQRYTPRDMQYIVNTIRLFSEEP